MMLHQITYCRTTHCGTLTSQVNKVVGNRCIDSIVSGFLLPERTYVNIFDAVLHGDIESIKLAINRGTSVNVRDRFQKTLLMEACCHGRIDIIDYLLANRSVSI